jgi:hypothetical protein
MDGKRQNRIRANLWLAAFIAGLFLVGACAPLIHCDDPGAPAPCQRILFIGNSYTYVNDLPAMFARLAWSGGHAVQTGMQAQGGWTLAQHQVDAATLQAIAGTPWDFVILQEQSEIPAMPAARTGSMYPAATALVEIIRARGSQPLLLMTWAHRDGLSSAGLADYASMQSQIEDGYLELANALDVGVVPAGVAWGRLREEHPDLDVWQSDGSHPSETGTYLAACVLYVSLYRESPLGLMRPLSITEENARIIQTLAEQTVLSRPTQWHLQ